MIKRHALVTAPSRRIVEGDVQPAAPRAQATAANTTDAQQAVGAAGEAVRRMPCGAQLQQVCISGEKCGLDGWAREARRPGPAGAIAPALVLALAY